MDLDNLQGDPQSGLEESITASIRSESAEEFDPDHDGIRTYALLVLSGGGSSGAFGAGFLTGWSETGTRPDFKVVTGISVGSLQATFALLGPEYDDELTAIFTLYATEEIYQKRSLFRKLFGDAVYDTSPLKELIDRYIDEDTLTAVAAKHARGYRLYVGTTNMDTLEFIIWDMGRIASSRRPGALELYRNILLASSSIPVLFPPVYLGVEAEGKTYYEMHVDGGANSQVFFRGFMLDFEDALLDAKVPQSSVNTQLYILRNGKPYSKYARHNVNPRSISIASATIRNQFKLSTTTSLYRIYVLANKYGIDFNLATIPPDFEIQLDTTVFDLEKMQQLYDLGYGLARDGYEWMKAPPRLDPDEIFEEH
jgi:predicted acylesterase/phospholipase RssA